MATAQLVPLDLRRTSETFVRFRNQLAMLSWSTINSLEYDLVAINRGRSRDDEPSLSLSAANYGKFAVISERANSDRYCNERLIRLKLSVSQLEKRAKIKQTDLEIYFTIYRKCLSKDDQMIVYLSPKTKVIASTSIHKFPETVISKEKLLGGSEDRMMRFTLRNAADNDVIGEAEILCSRLINDRKMNLKLRSRDPNCNTLFGVTKRSFHHVGILHVNLCFDGRMSQSTSAAGSTGGLTSQSSSAASSSRGSTASSSNATDDKFRPDLNDDDCYDSSNVMMATGRTQAYLISLLAPNIEVRLREPFQRIAENDFDPDYCKYLSNCQQN